MPRLKVLEEEGDSSGTWQVWLEGYSMLGNSSQATFLGKYVAADFKAAILMACRAHEYDTILVDIESEVPTYWSRRFFDNEADARRVYG